MTPEATINLRRKRVLVISAAIVAWVLLLGFAVISTSDPIEAELTSESRSALEAAGVEFQTISFNGRDATLTGQVSTESAADSAESIVAAVPGVRTVNNNMEVVPTTQVPVPPTTVPTATAGAGSSPPSFVMLVSGGQVALAGSIPDDGIGDSIYEGAVEAFGQENVITRMTAGAEIRSETWIETLPFLLVEMGDVTEFSMVIVGGTVELTGLAENALAKASIEATVAASMPDLTIVNLLEVGVDEPEVVQSKLDAVDMTTVIFGSGSATMSSGSTDALDEVVAILVEHASISVEIGGHTDATGDDDDNLELSQLRAETVMGYFIDHGIDAARLTAVGYGSAQPIADNFSAEGRAMNRRIEITLAEDV